MPFPDHEGISSSGVKNALLARFAGLKWQNDVFFSSLLERAAGNGSEIAPHGYLPEFEIGMNMIRAIGLLSGGLDSTLSAKLLMDQGIEVHAVNFASPFCTCTPKSAGCAAILTAVVQLGGIPLKRVFLGDAYLEMVKAPRFGYGRGMNPCIDCRIMKIRKAAEIMKEIGASFLFTGEVLGQRPMSQHRQAIQIIDRESGISGLILRPLSARVFPPTIPEQKGWVDRDRLLGVTGRSRKVQLALASRMEITDYRCPAGGCLLTEKQFVVKLKDYFEHTKTPSWADMALLKVGRHFRLDGGGKIVVARNQAEGEKMIHLRRKGWKAFIPEGFSAPVVLLEGTDEAAAMQKMRAYTNRPIPPDAIILVTDDNGAARFRLDEYSRQTGSS
jgi:tRNA-uridine 2-sulfurtransferase